MSSDGIFLTSDEVMDRWGMVEPNDFTNMIGFEFSPTDDITITRSDHRYRYRPGDLLAYDKFSREPAVWRLSQDGQEMEFSRFVDQADDLDPVCLQYLTFTFHDVEECERRNPELLRYAEWARSYREKTGQTAKQVLDELYTEDKKLESKAVDGESKTNKLVDEKNDPQNPQNLRGHRTEENHDGDSLPIADEHHVDEMVYSKQAIDKSGRYALRDFEEVRARCQVIAELILEQKPELRAAQLSKSRYIKDLACTLRSPAEKGDGIGKVKLELTEMTLRSYLRHLCKPDIKGTLTEDQRNQEIVIDVHLEDNKI